MQVSKVATKRAVTGEIPQPQITDQHQELKSGLSPGLSEGRTEVEAVLRPRKRRRFQDNEDLESAYFKKLRAEERKVSGQLMKPDGVSDPSQESGIDELPADDDF